MDRRIWAVIAAVAIVAVIGVLYVYYPVLYLPFFFLFIPIGLFSGRGSRSSEGHAPSEGVRFCPECGNQVGPGDSFCPQCGRRMRYRSGIRMRRGMRRGGPRRF